MIFNIDYLSQLDSSAPTEKSGQFDFRLKNDGSPYAKSFNVLEPDRFNSVLQRSEELMREFGERIYSGDVSIHPSKKGKEIACWKCRFQPVCRFDAWTQKFNHLQAPEETD